MKAYQDQGDQHIPWKQHDLPEILLWKGQADEFFLLKPGMAVFKWNTNIPEKFDDKNWYRLLLQKRYE